MLEIKILVMVTDNKIKECIVIRNMEEAITGMKAKEAKSHKDIK